jgi:hypothetical protein
MPNIDFVNEELIVSEVAKNLRLKYYFFATSFILLEALVLYLGYDYDGIFYFVFLILLIRYGNVLKRPANWRPVKIRVSEENIFVNNKALRKEDLICLSFHQTEKCSIIRLEAKRNNILIPNEAKILSDCSNEEEATQICRVLRDYIDPNLQICFVRLVKGKRRSSNFKTSLFHSSYDTKFEKRDFIA